MTMLMLMCNIVKLFVSILLEDFEELIKVRLGEACLRAATHRQAKHTQQINIDGFAPLSPSLTESIIKYGIPGIPLKIRNHTSLFSI